ncbi:MAG TPA: ATP-binding protein, partial [Anaerolineae bacterium]|nr:ATP-binding protein [Anaerolineae bacterium]
DFYRPTQNLKRQLPSTIEIDSFDSFYRPQADELHSIDLHQVLEDVLQLANKQLQHSHITVERFWEPTLPPMRGNPDYLKQVFLNLVLNAIDALSMGGGVLRISTALASIQRPTDTKPRPAARLEFSDTGAGISPEALAHLFEPLFTTKGHGSGLGLFISYKIIEGHQGQILVNSAAGQGTTFTILLPLNQNQGS